MSQQQTISIMLVDDHAVVRSGLRRMLELRPDMVVIAEAGSGEQAYQMYYELHPDVVIMDLSMPGMGGLEALRRIMTRDPKARMLVFSMHDNVSFIGQALKSGAKGYVTKTGISDELIKAVLEIAHGNTYLSSDIAQKMVMQTLTGDASPLRDLSVREFEVFRLLAEGRTVEDIGELLKISQKTVSNYQTIIRQKLGVATAIDLMRLAMRHGVISE